MSDHQSIGEVLATLRGDFPDITISKIRFLESQGLIDPERTPSGYRKFRDGDIARLRWILHQQKNNFLPLKVIKARLDEVGPDGLPGDLGPAGDAELAADAVVESPARATRASKPAKAARAPRKKAATATKPAGGRASPAAPKPKKSAPAKVARTVTPALFEEPMLPLDDGSDDDLAADPSGASLTRADLAAAVGLDVVQLAELEEFGLLAPAAGSGDRVVFDETALVIAKLAAEFAAHGIGPRHLRMFRVFAEREAGLYDQVIAPRLKRKNPEARAQAREDLVDLVRLGRAMRAAFLRDAASGLLRD